MRTTEEASEPASERERAPWLERLASTVGLVLILAMVGFIGIQAWQAADDVPIVEVSAIRVEERGTGFIVVIDATNPTEATAAEVEVEGALISQGRPVETSRTSFDYVPGGSSRTGGLFFSHDPRSFDLKVRALGYAEP